MLYIYITLYARYFSSKVCNFPSFTKMSTWTQNFSPRLVGLTADHDASRGGRLQGSLEVHVPPP